MVKRSMKPAAAAMAGALFCAGLAAAPAEAREWRPWCGEPGGEPVLGWHFYCDPAAEEKADSPEAPPDSPAAALPDTAMEQVHVLRRELEEARAAAVLAPTPENVAAYLHLQQDALQRAAIFSDAFRRVVWATPGLDYTLKRPAGALAKQLWSDDRRVEVASMLARLGERYGLIYVGHTDCGGCRVFGPLLRAFALRHGLDVLAVSMTGEALEGWPEAVPDRGLMERLGLAGSPVPAVVLFDTETGRALPISFGVIAEDQLAERIFALTARELGNDY